MLINQDNNVHFQESIDTFRVKFEGGNSIDAELFTRTINNIVDLVKASAQAVDPNAFLRLEIKATKEGSFETVIDAVAKYTPDLINKDNTRLACEIVTGFLAFLQVKSHLKGRKAKSIESKGKISYVKNQDGEEVAFPKNAVEVYFGDSKIDNTVVNIFTDLKESGREGLLVEHTGQVAPFKKEDCDNMTAHIVEQDKTAASNKTSETIKQCSLTLRKPDLIGRSKWGVIFAGHPIDIKITDEEFLTKFREGKVIIFSGCKLICDLNIKSDMDEEYNPIKSEYEVIKVHGIQGKEEQLNLFQEETDI